VQGVEVNIQNILALNIVCCTCNCKQYQCVIWLSASLIYSACKYVATANAKWIKFGVENRWWNIIDKLYLKYA